MTIHRHTREQIGTFLARDFRQVWAIDRVTREPRYLPDGQADALRDVAKQEWSCPFPDCDVQLTTRGKSRRDHFVHMTRAVHESGGESDAHLAAKAMLAEWATSRMPAGGAVRQEETVKDRDSDLHRIADVMATWPNGSKTAFEVEYKPFTAEAWKIKQDNYDAVNMPCAWLLGHTRVRPVPERSRGVGDWSNAVNIPPLGQAIARSGRHLLVINPTDKMIGTVAGDREFSSLPSYGFGWIALDHVDDCDIDPLLGIITPTMRRIDALAAAREAEDERDAAQWAAEVASREAWEKTTAEQRAAKESRIERMKADQAKAWAASEILSALIDRWGTVPAVLNVHLGTHWGVWAAEPHWHAVIYETLLHDKTPDNPFTIADVGAALKRHGIRQHTNYGTYFKGLVTYLEYLQAEGLLTLQKDHGRIERVTPTGWNADVIARAMAERLNAQAREKNERAQAAAARKREREATAQAARDEAERDYQARKQAQAISKANAQARWDQSSVRATLVATHGSVPNFISWHSMSADEIATSADLADHWHAYLYIGHIHEMPTGSHFSSDEALRTLYTSPVRLTGEPDQIERAVKAYLFSLSQRGVLAPLGVGRQAEGTVIYTVE